MKIAKHNWSARARSFARYIHDRTFNMHLDEDKMRTNEYTLQWLRQVPLMKLLIV